MISKSLLVGSGYIHNVSEVLSKHDIHGKILYVSGPVVHELYGSVVKPQIEDVGILKEEIVDNNTISYAMSMAERAIATDIDCIVGLGGGKVLDVCKYASYIAKIPFLSVPTTMSNDGLVSPIAVLKRQDGKPKSLGCAIPEMMLLDIDVAMKGPVQQIKAGIGDMISNYLALMDWDFACQRGKDKMNGYAYLMSKTSLESLMATKYETICPEFLEALANSLILSGIAMDFAGSSRPVSGSEHLFSHALDYYSERKNLHGLQTALGTVAVLKLLNKNTDEVVGYLKRFDVNVNPEALGIDEETFISCMQKATSMRNNRYTFLHEIDLCRDVLHQVYQVLTEEL